MSTALTALDMPLATVEPRDVYHARTLARIAERAATLEEQGYTLTQTESLAGMEEWDVVKPDGTTYTVTLDDPFDGDYCTCQAFASYQDCKHRLAVLHRKAREAAN